MSSSDFSQKIKMNQSAFQRRISLNTSFDSGPSTPITDRCMAEKTRLSKEKAISTSKQIETAKFIRDEYQQRRSRVCEGQRISREAIQIGSKEKQKQFLERFARDPFLRRKFEKSIEKVKKSDSPVYQKDDKPLHTLKKYTTFREEALKQSKKTHSLISNCKNLVAELRKNRVTQNPEPAFDERKNVRVLRESWITKRNR